jgi:FAD:protein FMN transferase
MNAILVRVFPFLTILLFFACKQPEPQKVTISGEAQGTTYSITYYSEKGFTLKKDVDSLLLAFDFSLSTYNPQSLVTRINNNEENLADEFLLTVLAKSLEISEATDGAFDVTAGPIFNAWGFGHTPKAKTDSAGIQQLFKHIGYKKVRFEGNRIFKEDSMLTMNFNAIAQGYSVDVVAEFLKNKGINNFIIEIGGEIRASGKKANGEAWKVGIDKPVEDAEQRQLQAIISLNDKSLATSGNYRKFYVENGQKYSHTIDLKTGFPSRNNLLSATVVADNCMAADAYATAFMAMGLEKSVDFLKKCEDCRLEAFFIYDSNGLIKVFTTPGLEALVEELQ